MRIGILSDSHDNLPALRAMLEALIERKVDALFHAGDFVAPFAAKLLLPDAGIVGDIPVYVVLGNNDGEHAGLRKLLPQLPPNHDPLKITLANKQICMSHFIDWLKPEEIHSADIIISGHTHQAGVSTRNDDTHGDTLCINPGEVGGWLTGRYSSLILDLISMEYEWVDLSPKSFA